MRTQTSTLTPKTTTRTQIQGGQIVPVTPGRVSPEVAGRLMAVAEVLNAMAAVAEARPGLSFADILDEALDMVQNGDEPTLAELQHMAEALYPGVDFSATPDAPADIPDVLQ
jgi:hypothetical protein